MFKKISVIGKYFNQNLNLMFIGNIITVLLNIATVKVLTNKYDTSDFGVYSLSMAFNVFPQLVLFAPISASIFPFVQKHKNEKSYSLFQKQVFDLFYFVVLLLTFLIALFAIFNFYTGLYPFSTVYLLLLSLSFSTTISALTTLDTFSLANSNTKEYVVFPIINMFIKLLMLAVLFQVKISPYNLILLFCVFQFLFFFVELSYLRKKAIVDYMIRINFKDIFTINTEIKKEIIKYAQNFCLWGAFAWLQTFLDKFLLKDYTNSSAVAIYAVYYQYGFFPFTILSSVISQYITPIYFSKTGNDTAGMLVFLKKLLVNTLLFLFITCLILPILSYYIAPFFIRVLTTKEYLKFIQYFPIIVLAGCFYCYSQILTVPLLHSDLVKKIRFPKIASSVLAVILFALLAPKYNLLGILTALMVSNIFYFVVILIANLQFYRSIKFPKYEN